MCSRVSGRPPQKIQNDGIRETGVKGLDGGMEEK
jgi:hypothetical protein